MTATIEVAGERARIENGRWESANKELEALLNTMGDPAKSASDPAPDLNTAERVVAELGPLAKVVAWDEPDATSSGTIY